MQIVVPPLPLCQFFSTQTVVYSLSFLMGHNCRSFTPIVGCGQASSLKERLFPPSFSNHSSVDVSLDYPPCLFCMFHRHFMFNMSLKSFPPCWVPSIQAYKSDTWELTTLLLQTICRPSSHPLVFLQTVSLLCYFCLKPISSVWKLTSTACPVKPVISLLSTSPFHGCHGSWGKDTSSPHG